MSADWLIMVYISADDVLANFAIESLKQLKRAATKEMVVIAQMDAVGNRETKLYRFDGSDKDPNSSLTKNEITMSSKPPSGGIANPATLTHFINEASKYDATHHALFPYGHGPELLLDENSKSKGRNY